MAKKLVKVVSRQAAETTARKEFEIFDIEKEEQRFFKSEHGLRVAYKLTEDSLKKAKKLKLPLADGNLIWLSGFSYSFQVRYAVDYNGMTGWIHRKATPAERRDARIYRLDKDHNSGLLSDDEYKTLKSEIETDYRQELRQVRGY